MYNDAINYKGEVIINFIKDNKIINTIKTHNTATPAFFECIMKLLKEGIDLPAEADNDFRPGKLDLGKIKDNIITPQLSSLSPKLDCQIREEENGDKYLEYTFVVGYYQIMSQGDTINLQDGDWYTLLYSSFKSSTSSVDITPPITDTALLAYANIPKNIAQDNPDYYTLIEGSYINILWRFYFDNKD